VWKFRVRERTLVNVGVDGMTLFDLNIKLAVGRPGVHWSVTG